MRAFHAIAARPDSGESTLVRIRKKQVEQFAQSRRHKSQRILMAELRESAPTATAQYTDAELLDVMEQASQKAASYGIESSDSTTAFVKLAVFAGLNFDNDPTVQRFLRSPELTPDFKTQLLASLVAEKLKAYS